MIAFTLLDLPLVLEKVKSKADDRCQPFGGRREAD
jgi:hypothetical protein